MNAFLKTLGHFRSFLVMAAVTALSAGVAAGASAQEYVCDSEGRCERAQNQQGKNRKGFVLDLGLGASRIGYSGGGSDTGVGSDFKIGHAPTNQLMIYYHSAGTFYTIDDFSGGSDLYTLGISGIGATWFLKPGAPSAYVDGTIGRAAWNVLDLDGGGAENIASGWGFSLGGGFEFARHWLLSGDIIMTRLEFDTNATTMRVGLRWLLY